VNNIEAKRARGTNILLANTSEQINMSLHVNIFNT